MTEVYAFPLAIIILVLGIPLGNLLAKITKEELKSGKKWFKLFMIICLICAVIFLFFRNYVIFFGLLFMAIVTSRSLIR